MLKLSINGNIKTYNDVWEARWDIEEVVEIDAECIKEMVNDNYPTIEIMGVQFEPYEILENCSDWLIDQLIEEETDYVLDEIVYEIEHTEEGQIERFNYLVDIYVYKNE